MARPLRNNFFFAASLITCKYFSFNTGLVEIATIQENEGLTSQLYKWIETANEPLNSYATGQCQDNFVREIVVYFSRRKKFKISKAYTIVVHLTRIYKVSLFHSGEERGGW